MTSPLSLSYMYYPGSVHSSKTHTRAGLPIHAPWISFCQSRPSPPRVFFLDDLAVFGLEALAAANEQCLTPCCVHWQSSQPRLRTSFHREASDRSSGEACFSPAHLHENIETTRHSPGGKQGVGETCPVPHLAAQNPLRGAGGGGVPGGGCTQHNGFLTCEGSRASNRDGRSVLNTETCQTHTQTDLVASFFLPTYQNSLQ